MSDSVVNRVISAVHANQQVQEDPEFVQGMGRHLRESCSREELLLIYARHANGTSTFDQMMRRILWRALCKAVGNGLKVEDSVGFKHPETFEIGNNVFIGAQTFIQGRFDGTCVIGDNCWIGPQSYFDARNMVLEEFVGWGPGAKVLGSEHTGLPIDVPILKTNLEVKPVHIGAWCDVGTNAIILPGITIGKGAIVAAGAVVTHDVEPYTVVAGVPARFLKKREEK